MRYVVGIDMSLARTGITVLAGGGDDVARPTVLRDCGYSLSNSPSWDESSDRIAIQARTIYALLDKIPTKPDMVLIEAMIPPKNALPSYLERGALWYGIWSGVKARDIPRAVVHPTTLKKWATGHGRAEKEDVHGEVSTWWPNLTIANHDIADSAVLAAMAGVHLGWKMPFEIRRRHSAGLVIVKWPDAPDPDFGERRERLAI